ncbi:MAG: hypothetical protein ABR553_08105, partial [Gammaproteobacteria bacterium]
AMGREWDTWSYLVVEFSPMVAIHCMAAVILLFLSRTLLFVVMYGVLTIIQYVVSSGMVTFAGELDMFDLMIVAWPYASLLIGLLIGINVWSKWLQKRKNGGTNKKGTEGIKIDQPQKNH